MATLLEENVSEKKKKKKRKMEETKPIRRNLRVGQIIEVRSTEEGFHGSWHLATIIGLHNSICRVRYEHLLVDDGSSKLIETISFPSVMDRGLVRPQPPPLETHPWFLSYGLCVDSYLNEVWWEGVIFDNEEGSNERLVFFPDLGDQLVLKIENLRITQDWDEVSECWKIRGNWLFLELIEEHEKEWPVLVSLRQIWFDVRAKEVFYQKIREWTCWVRPIWDDLVLEVILEYLNLTAECVRSVIDQENASNFVVGTSKRARHGRKSAIKCKFDGDISLKHEKNSTKSHSKRSHYVLDEVVLGGQVEDSTALELVLQNEDRIGNMVGPSVDDLRMEIGDRCINNILDDSCDPKDITLRNNVDELICNVTCSDLTNSKLGREDETQREVYRDTTDGLVSKNNSISDEPNTKPKSLASREKRAWVPAGPKILPGAEYCPDALINYLLIVEKGMSCRKELKDITYNSATLKARMHLSYIGWKIEIYNDKRMVRVRYIPPKGTIMYSLTKICKHLMETTARVQSPRSQNGCYSLVDIHVEQHQGSKGGGGSSILVEKTREKPHALEFSKRKTAPERFDSDVAIEPEYCPQAVVDWYEHGSQVGGLMSLRLKAKKHLLAVGWKFWYATRQQIKRELCYTSPQKRTYYSLRTACKGCMDESLSESKRPMKGVITSEGPEVPLNGDSFSAMISTKVKENMLPINGQSGLLQLREFLEFGNVMVKRVRGPRKRRIDSSFPLTSMLLQNQMNPIKKLGHTLDHNVGYHEPKKRKTTRERLIGSRPSCVLRSSKRARQVVVSSPSHHTPRTVLSWLIDNNVVLPRSKVHCMSTKGQHLMFEGRITRDGIKCNCCQKAFSLTGFESHAGSMYRRPAASICLEDGRSLLECQKQMLQGNKLKSFVPEPYKRIKSNQPHIENDYICSVCHYGGTLVLCDQCPSSFHLSCLGLEDLPEGNWFCPSCQCGICGQGEFNGNVEQFTEKTVLYCDQCEREYHVGCVRKRGPGKLHSCPKGNWFCSKKCEKIFVGLHKLLGKAVPVRVDNLSWTILKFSRDSHHKNASDIETMTEHHSKLNVALAVMHECFEPIKELHTKDLVKDVLFNKRSVLNRLNFQGFYTVLLEREDELISVATVRIYGDKVAEVPLVGTRVQFRRRGMCRILMDVLEKKLTELGVKTLVLPAVPQLLNAWTTSFGFSKMTRSERLEFLEYTFLNFQDTTMCQKILRMTPTSKFTGPRGNRHELGSELNQSIENIDLEYIPTVVPVECVDCVPIKPVPPIVVTQQVNASEFNQQNNEISMDGNCSIKSSDEGKEDKRFGNVGCMKYYSRRKKSVRAEQNKEDIGLHEVFFYKYSRRRRYQANNTLSS